MSLFFETIRIQNGTARHLSYHNRRCARTRKRHFPHAAPLDLAAWIDPPTQGLLRCKIVYDHSVREVTYHPYHPRSIRRFVLLSSSIAYPDKALDRSALDLLFARRGAADEILIVQEGLLRDTSIANIALYDGLKWYTPRKPLLEGTCRARLLERGFLLEKDVTMRDLRKAAGFAVMNAMVGFVRIDRAEFLEGGEDAEPLFS